MGDLGGVAQAGASIADTSATNATNLQMQDVANQFNASQAALQRTWSADQAQKQMAFNASQAQTTRTFQDQQRIAAQDYNTEMSNTQVQRRAQDIQQAGFNPLLAVSQLGGASSPTSSPMPGATASAGIPGGSAASAAGVARMQPLLQNAASLNLTNAQASATKAQTRKTVADAGIAEDNKTLLDTTMTPDLLFKRQQVIAANYDLDYAKAQEVDAAVTTIRNVALKSGLDVKGGELDNAFAGFRNQMASMDTETQRATMNQLIKMQNAINAQQTQEARNVTEAQSGLTGKAIAYAQAVATGVGSASQAAGHASSLFSRVKSFIP